jgi:hypothetical protein
MPPCKTKSTPRKLTWLSAARRKLHRRSPCGLYDEIIDAGVNFFVVALEKLGATTMYSCEGHPSGFYIMFEAPMCVAVKIRKAGYFTVELEGLNLWSIRLPHVDMEYDRRIILNGAARSWTRHFGPFYPEDVNRGAPLRNVLSGQNRA